MRWVRRLASSVLRRLRPQGSGSARPAIRAGGTVAAPGSAAAAGPTVEWVYPAAGSGDQRDAKRRDLL